MCCGENSKHCYEGTESIVVVVGGVGEHCFVMEGCCGRSWATRGVERGYRRSVVVEWVLHLLHVFSFLTQL